MVSVGFKFSPSAMWSYPCGCPMLSNVPQTLIPSRESSDESQMGLRFFPFLRWLSMDDHITPLVWSTIAQYGMLSASFAAARDTLKAWGIAVSLKRLERLTYRFGHLGLFRRQERVNQLQHGTLPNTPILKDQRVVISVDGGRTRIRRPKKGKPRQTTNRHGYYRDWTEPKLLTIYVVDALFLSGLTRLNCLSLMMVPLAMWNCSCSCWRCI